MPPAPSERPVNTSKEQDIAQMLQATLDFGKVQRKGNISMQEQGIRKMEIRSL